MYNIILILKYYIKGDGIFDQLTNINLIKLIWETSRDNVIGFDINDHCGRCVDMIIKSAMHKNTLDNVTCILISFENFKNILYSEDTAKTGNTLRTIRKSISSLNVNFKMKTNKDNNKEAMDKLEYLINNSNSSNNYISNNSNNGNNGNNNNVSNGFNNGVHSNSNNNLIKISTNSAFYNDQKKNESESKNYYNSYNLNEYNKSPTQRKSNYDNNIK